MHVRHFLTSSLLRGGRDQRSTLIIVMSPDEALCECSSMSLHCVVSTEYHPVGSDKPSNTESRVTVDMHRVGVIFEEEELPLPITRGFVYIITYR